MGVDAIIVTVSKPIKKYGIDGRFSVPKAKRVSNRQQLCRQQGGSAKRNVNSGNLGRGCALQDSVENVKSGNKLKHPRRAWH